MRIHNIQATGSQGLSGNQAITGSLTVTGNIIAQQYVVSSSVLHLTESYASGSHIFGNSLDDTHQFTGSVYVSGSLKTTGLIESMGDNSNEGGQLVLRGSNYRFNIDNYQGNSVRIFRENDSDSSAGLVLMQISSSGHAAITHKLSVNNPISPYANGITVGGTGTGIMMYSTSTGNQTSIQILNASNYNYGTMGVVSGNGLIGGDVYGLGYTGNANSTFTSALSWTSTGNIGIGENSPQAYWSAANKLVIYKAGQENGMTFVGDANHSATIAFALGITGSDRYKGYIQYYHSTNTMYLGVDAADRVAITSDGSVCLGTTSRAGAWGLITLRNTANAAGAKWGIGPDTADCLTVYNNSNVGVYMCSGATSWSANSDIRLKDINSQITDAVTTLKTLRAVKYTWKSDENKKLNIGLIAQDVQAVLPELVDVRPDELGILGVRYTELIPVLIAGIQEQQSQIEILQNRLEALENV